VIQLPFQNRYGRNVLLAIAEGGSNNLIDNRSNRLVREWYPIAIGDPLDVMTCIIKGSADCEWGSLRFANQRATKPENYIRHWRSLVDQPLSSKDALEQGYSFSDQIEVTLCLSQLLKRDESALKQLDRSITALATLGMKAESRKSSFYEVYPHKDAHVWVWTFDLSNQHGWDLFHHNAPVINPNYLRGLSVYGPTKYRLMH
jgi:hypothetical protein